MECDEAEQCLKVTKELSDPLIELYYSLTNKANKTNIFGANVNGI